jgi:hypothetical protein
MSNLAKGVIITLVVVLLGLIYLYLAMVGPLQDLNLGFGLAAGLQNEIVAGYKMANLVLFLIFLVIIVICGAILLTTAKKKPEVEP